MVGRDRTTYLGGSDAAGVLGLSRWDTPLSIWAEKTGQFNDDSGNTDAKNWGKRHEPTIIQWFQEETGKKIVDVHRKFFHPAHDFLETEVDGLIDGEDAGFEAKTCDAWKSKEWEGEEIPREYIIQAHHAMLVTGIRKWYIAVLIGGNKAHWKEIPWDESFIETLRLKEVEFWERFVVPKVMPSFITKNDAPVLDGLFPEASAGKIIALEDEANILIENLQALKADSKNVENQIDQLENQLKALLKDAEEGRTSLYRVSWQNVVSRRFDLKSFEVAYPELSKQFKPEKTSRRFSYKPVKEEANVNA